MVMASATEQSNKVTDYNKVVDVAKDSLLGLANDIATYSSQGLDQVLLQIL
jgi:hypothetical protein